MKKQFLLVVSILLLGISIISAQTPKIITGGVLNGKATNLPIPEYPAAAKAVKASGTVNVQITIDENGSVAEASAVSGHPLLRQAAENAARQATFSPTQLSGQAVKVTGIIVYNFTPSTTYTIAPQMSERNLPNSTIGEQSPLNGSVKTITGGVINGKAKNLVIPAYPAAAKAVGASGAVNVQVIIDENGDVVSANSVSGHPLLRAAAEKAALASKFSPTMLQGQPVRVTGIIVYNFAGDKPAPGNEEKLKFMGIGAALSAYDLLDDAQFMTKEDLAETPQIADELTPLTTITNEMSKEERNKIVRKVTASVEKKLTGADAWQFQFGKVFAELLTEFPKDSTDNTKIINETAVKTSLLKMKNLLFTVPSDLPADVLVKFKEMTKFTDVQNLNSTDNRNRFSQLIMETLNLISPDSSK